MIPRFNPVSFPSTPAPRLRRCFATTADGRIPLTPDWPRLFQSLATLPQVVLQTRHTYGRLVALAPLPDGDAATGRFHQSCSAHLLLNYAHWHDAWARIAVCDCCNSPGRIEVVNAQGAEFLQICAPADLSPADWATIVAPFTGRAPAELSPPPEHPDAPLHAVPILSPSARPFGLSPVGLPRLLQSVTASGHAFATNLRTATASQTRITCPDHITFDGHHLCFTDGGTTLQLILPPRARLHTQDTSHGRWLHLSNAEDSVLLSFGPGHDTGPSRDVWDAALDEITPA